MRAAVWPGVTGQAGRKGLDDPDETAGLSIPLAKPLALAIARLHPVREYGVPAGRYGGCARNKPLRW